MKKNIIYFIALIVCSCNNETNHSVNNETTETSKDVTNIESIGNKPFKDFVNLFKPTDLPINLDARKDGKYYSENKSSLIDSSMAIAFICNGAAKCLKEKDRLNNWVYSLNFYSVCSLKKSNKYILLIYFTYSSNGTNYYLNSYSLAGEIISSINLSGLIGDVYEMNGTIDKDFNIKTEKMIFLPQKVNPQEFDLAIKESNTYQIKEDGKIELATSTKSEPKKYHFTDDEKYEEIK